MSILVTGATGFLGDYVLDEFEKNSENYSYVSRSISKNREATFVKCDLSSAMPDLKEIKFEKVIHLAGLAHDTKENNYSEDDYYETNLNGTKRLLKAIDISGEDVKHFVYISTVAVYGVVTGSDISENHELLGESAYAKSKIAAEQAIKEWASKNNTSLLILRLPLIIGKNAKGNLKSLSLMADRKFVFNFYPDGGVKSVVHAKDVSELICSNRTNHGTFNLTDNVGCTFNQLSDYCGLESNRSFKVYIPLVLLRSIGMVGDFIQKMGLRFPITTSKINKMSTKLTFDTSHAKKTIGWNPMPALLR